MRLDKIVECERGWGDEGVSECLTVCLSTKEKEEERWCFVSDDLRN